MRPPRGLAALVLLLAPALSACLDAPPVEARVVTIPAIHDRAWADYNVTEGDNLSGPGARYRMTFAPADLVGVYGWTRGRTLTIEGDGTVVNQSWPPGAGLARTPLTWGLDGCLPAWMGTPDGDVRFGGGAMGALFPAYYLAGHSWTERGYPVDDITVGGTVDPAAAHADPKNLLVTRIGHENFVLEVSSVRDRMIEVTWSSDAVGTQFRFEYGDASPFPTAMYVPPSVVLRRAAWSNEGEPVAPCPLRAQLPPPPAGETMPFTQRATAQDPDVPLSLQESIAAAEASPIGPLPEFLQAHEDAYIVYWVYNETEPEAGDDPVQGWTLHYGSSSTKRLVIVDCERSPPVPLIVCEAHAESELRSPPPWTARALVSYGRLGELAKVLAGPTEHCAWGHKLDWAARVEPVLIAGVCGEQIFNPAEGREGLTVDAATGRILEADPREGLPVRAP